VERGTPVKPKLSFGFLTLRTTRLPFLTATLVPVLLGILIAASHGSFDLVAAILTIIGACFVQLGLNVANDVFDTMSGADDANVTPTQLPALAGDPVRPGRCARWRPCRRSSTSGWPDRADPAGDARLDRAPRHRGRRLHRQPRLHRATAWFVYRARRMPSRSGSGPDAPGATSSRPAGVGVGAVRGVDPGRTPRR
jgi:hypothetical protein